MHDQQLAGGQLGPNGTQPATCAAGLPAHQATNSARLPMTMS